MTFFFFFLQILLLLVANVSKKIKYIVFLNIAVMLDLWFMHQDASVDKI